MIYNIIFCLFLFVSLSAYTEEQVTMKGLVCHDTVPWTKSEKTKFKGKLLADNITKFFFLSSQAYIKKNDFCAYKSADNFFRVGFKEKKHSSGSVIFVPTGKAITPKYKKTLWIEHGIYVFSPYAVYELKELLRLKYRNISSPRFSLSMKHKGYFQNLDYISFIIVTYDNKEKYLFAMKVRPK
ncbi:hypothetical protein MS2017_0834 [Bathymodiolus thermophilus thioautotrophic gill symbiont]|uniref:Uncharacterized protein n=1 Tax=Bathymodiolus thermophilus thioautotrophic gill symbiont TaxID=2360 RepID=A0A3G3IL52_9GAMM|nr:hypothetical protein [Bathymodiolus thermophilus thioautotrophic gill symbiont]AYQ56556.1 hypothetical protein MS2017_0834 [Bathymodiolus thermophilus thioautotrophic gill symbiont]